MTTIRDTDTSAGRIRIEDSGGDGPVLVFLHGLLVDATLWRKVVAALAGSHRCVVPTLPLGAHPYPMRAEADVSPRGQALLVAELLELLDLENVTLVANDTGGAIAQLLVTQWPNRVARLVLTPSDAFENFFPPIYRPLQVAARVPGLVETSVRALALRPLRRLPIAFGWLANDLPTDLSDGWLHPFLTNADVRRDTRRFLLDVDQRLTLEAASRLPTFDRPALVAWAANDRIFPIAHGRRLAELLPQGRFESIPDSRTFVPVDQPEMLSNLLATFVGDTATADA